MRSCHPPHRGEGSSPQVRRWTTAPKPRWRWTALPISPKSALLSIFLLEASSEPRLLDLAHGGNRIGDGDRAPGLHEVQALHHLAFQHNHPLVRVLGLLEGGDDGPRPGHLFLRWGEDLVVGCELRVRDASVDDHG